MRKAKGGVVEGLENELGILNPYQHCVHGDRAVGKKAPSHLVSVWSNLASALVPAA